MQTKSVDKPSKIPMPPSKIQQQAEALSQLLKLPLSTQSTPRLTHTASTKIPARPKPPRKKSVSPRSTNSLQEQSCKIPRIVKTKTTKTKTSKNATAASLPTTDISQFSFPSDSEIMRLTTPTELLLGDETASVGAASKSSRKSSTPKKVIKSDEKSISGDDSVRPSTAPAGKKVSKVGKKETDQQKPVSDSVTDMVIFLVENWISMTEKISQSRLQIAELAMNGKSDEVERINAENQFIQHEIGRAKVVTKEKINLITEYLAKIFETGTENEKLRKNQRQQNTKMAHLTVQMRNLEEQLKTCRTTAEKDKIQFESKMQRLVTDTENIKRSLQKQLKEKNNAIQKLTTECKHLKTEKEKLTLEVQPRTPLGESPKLEDKEMNTDSLVEASSKSNATLIDEIEAIRKESHIEIMDRCRNADMRNEGHFRKQIKVLKYTVKRLETTVETLATQNAELRRLVAQSRKLVGIDGDGEDTKDPLSERGVERALTSILHEKHRDVQKLAEIVRMMQRHCTAAQLQRSNLEARVKEHHKHQKHYH